MRRGEVWWADLPPPTGRRPVVLLSRDEAYESRQLVLVAPVTTRIRRILTEVPLGPADGLPRRCVANLDSITTAPKNRFQYRMALLTQEKLRSVDEAIHFALGLEW